MTELPDTTVRSELDRDRETARAIEIVLSRLRLDYGTAHVLRGNLGYVRQRISLSDEADAARPEANPDQASGFPAPAP